jgi:hypothetical protein
MRMNVRQCALILVLAGIGITGGTVRAAASPLPQDHAQASQNQDYSKNKKYQQGVSEGRDDRAHNQDHSKKTRFKKNEDQKAYEAGYRQGHQQK